MKTTIALALAALATTADAQDSLLFNFQATTAIDASWTKTSIRCLTAGETTDDDNFVCPPGQPAGEQYWYCTGPCSYVAQPVQPVAPVIPNNWGASTGRRCNNDGRKANGFICGGGFWRYSLEASIPRTGEIVIQNKGQFLAIEGPDGVKRWTWNGNDLNGYGSKLGFTSDDRLYGARAGTGQIAGSQVSINTFFGNLGTFDRNGGTLKLNENGQTLADGASGPQGFGSTAVISAETVQAALSNLNGNSLIGFVGQNQDRFSALGGN
jgi:hypothetical protein